MVPGTWGTSDLPRNLHNVGNTRKKAGISQQGRTFWQLHLQQLRPCMCCGVTPLQTLSPPSISWLGETPVGFARTNGTGEPPHEWESPGLWCWWLGGGCAGAAADGGVARGRVSQCPSCVPTTSCHTAAAARSESPAQRYPGGGFVPCVLPLSLIPRPCLSPAARRDDSLSPGWAPQHWFPPPEQTKRLWKG